MQLPTKMAQERRSKQRTTVISQKTKRKSFPVRDSSFDRTYESAVKSYQNYMEGLHLVLKEKERNMLKILRKRSSPIWFQDLTDEQCTICDHMLDAIGDDLNENTFHRSKDLLRQLGVYPICPDRIVRTALILCNRNDISFLWLLLELYYIRRPGKIETNLDGSYSINERLILSSIAHLDMITTLRGLEMVLPPRKRCGMGADEEKSGCESVPLKALPCRSPYSKPLVVTKTGYSVPLKPQLHRDEFLGRYSIYRDRTFTVRNEESRWFARYGGSGRNLFACKGYLSGSEEAADSETATESFHSADAVVKALLDENIRDMVDRVECCQMMCPKHQKLGPEGAHLLQDLQGNSAVREALMATVRSQCASWKEEELRADGKRQVESLLRRLVDEAVSMAILQPVDNCPECWQRFDMQQKLRTGQKCICATSNCGSACTSLSSPVSERKLEYFKLSVDATNPYHFDHRKIFDDEAQQKEALCCPIKKAIHCSLRGENDSANGGSIDQAIENFVRNTWQEALQQQKDRAAEEKNRLKNQPQPQETDPLDVEFIDTKDLTVLQNLLKRALRRLAERPKYMLATFPEVDKLPILIAWMRHRYGVPISRREREAALLESKMFWDTIVPRASTIHWPTRKDTGLKSTINWNYKRKLEALVAKLMHKFDRSLKNVQVQEGRLWSITMVPYHAGADRFRRTFAAYFPNCEPSMVPAMRPWPVYKYRAIPSSVLGKARR